MVDTPTTAPVSERPSGPAAAAILAVGIGALVLGFLTTLNEASTGVHDFLQLNDRVGPLSGKTIFAVIAYVVSWAALGTAWKDKEKDLGPVIKVGLVLLALGLLGTFPTFFLAFAPE